jgi:glyoxylase-like metal-dependent hydrolase (beta-lactamase superfamily II)
MADNSARLTQLGPRTYGYLHQSGSWGWSNCGLVVDPASGAAVLVDTQFTLDLTRRLLDAVAAAVPGARIDTVVNTHANGDHCWGNQLLPDATVVGSAAMACGGADEVSPAELTALVAGTGDVARDRYLREFFGHFDFGGVVVTPPAVTFSGRTAVCAGATAIELIEVGPAHTSGDVVAWVPGDRVVYAGDVLFVGDHPIMWSGPIDNWIRACERIRDLDPAVVVPGHGPVTDTRGLLVFRDYLHDVAEQARARFAAGMAYHEAAADLTLREPWRGWGHPERLVITVAAIYRELGGAPVDPLPQILSRTAAAWRPAPVTP